MQKKYNLTFAGCCTQIHLHRPATNIRMNNRDSLRTREFLNRPGYQLSGFVVVTGIEQDNLVFTGQLREIPDLAEVNAKLVKEGVRVLSFSEAKVDLENVFLAVTGKKNGKKDGPVVKASDPV